MLILVGGSPFPALQSYCNCNTFNEFSSWIQMSIYEIPLGQTELSKLLAKNCFSSLLTQFFCRFYPYRTCAVRAFFFLFFSFDINFAPEIVFLYFFFLFGFGVFFSKSKQSTMEIINGCSLYFFVWMFVSFQTLLIRDTRRWKRKKEKIGNV